MRVALMILLGLVIGIIGTVNVMNVLGERHPMPGAVMHTLGYHVGELKAAIKANQCDAAKIQHHLARLEAWRRVRTRAAPPAPAPAPRRTCWWRSRS